MLGLAAQGLFDPHWSPRILGEWQRAALRNHPDMADVIGAEIALCNVTWPNASVPNAPEIEAGLHLPDDNDVHVLATAIAVGASRIVTLNLKDFPCRTLAQQGIIAIHPDAFARLVYDANPAKVVHVVRAVQADAQTLSGQAWPIRKLMKKARLPRLGKAVESLDGGNGHA